MIRNADCWIISILQKQESCGWIKIISVCGKVLWYGTIAVMKDHVQVMVMTRGSESQYKAMFQRIVSLTEAYDGM